MKLPVHSSSATVSRAALSRAALSHTAIENTKSCSKSKFEGAARCTDGAAQLLLWLSKLVDQARRPCLAGPRVVPLSPDMLRAASPHKTCHVGEQAAAVLFQCAACVGPTYSFFNDLEGVQTSFADYSLQTCAITRNTTHSSLW